MRENTIEEKQQMTFNGDRMWNNFSDQCSSAKSSDPLWLYKTANALEHETLIDFVSISNDEPCYNNFLKSSNL